MALLAGTQLGPHEIVAGIGAGGMGEVYRARDTRLGRDFAIKVLPAAYSSDADRLRRFEQEARAAGLLNHPNIVTVYDVGSEHGSPYVVTELLEGETLRPRLAGGAIAPRRATEWALQIATGAGSPFTPTGEASTRSGGFTRTAAAWNNSPTIPGPPLWSRADRRTAGASLTMCKA